MVDAHTLQQAQPKQETNIERWGWYSIGINVLLALINLAVALASGSLAVEAEMVHNVVDLFTAIGVLIGLKLSTRKSKAFPYGLYKIENVITVVSGRDDLCDRLRDRARSSVRADAPGHGGCLDAGWHCRGHGHPPDLQPL